MKIKYVHIRTGQRGGVTFAYTNTDDHVAYNWAHCSARDQYSKKLGRRIAGGRLAKQPWSTFGLEQGTRDWELVRAIILDCTQELEQIEHPDDNVRQALETLRSSLVNRKARRGELTRAA